MNEAVKTLKQWIDDSDNIVFFGGAGVSTESGIKDFRSTDGLYHMKFKYPPETMLSHSFYESHTEEFYDFYRKQLMPPEDIQPNTAHLRLAELEKRLGVGCAQSVQMQQLLRQDAEEHGKRDAADRADARAEDFFAASAQNDEAHDRNQRTKQE